MKIIFDYDINPVTKQIIAVHFYELDNGDIFDHPDGSGVKIDTRSVLAYYNDHPELHERAGLAHTNQHRGENSPKTRWTRIVEHTRSDAGDRFLKDFNLTIPGEVIPDTKKKGVK